MRGAAGVRGAALTRGAAVGRGAAGVRGGADPATRLERLRMRAVLSEHHPDRREAC